MPNMSYCRFQNTLEDLRDCEDNLNFDDFEAQDMGNDERVARKNLIRICVDIARNYGDEVGQPMIDVENTCRNNYEP